MDYFFGRGNPLWLPFRTGNHNLGNHKGYPYNGDWVNLWDWATTRVNDKNLWDWATTRDCPYDGKTPGEPYLQLSKITRRTPKSSMKSTRKITRITETNSISNFGNG